MAESVLLPKPHWGGFAWLAGLPTLLRVLAIVCLALALARPRTVGGKTYIAARGVAIVVALDHSSSMGAKDFPTPSGPIRRLDAARNTFLEFLDGRPDDLIGLVAFANYPDPACLPTLDHKALAESANGVKIAKPGDDGTNIGDALAWSLATLRDTSPKKKVIILLTDGHNSPAVPKPADPEAMATLAQELGVRVHTIAIGPPGGMVRKPEPKTGLDLIEKGQGPDLGLLRSIADLGDGKAFVAVDSGELSRVFAEIDLLEKSELSGQTQTRYREHYASFVLPAVALIALDLLLSLGRLRRLP